MKNLWREASTSIVALLLALILASVVIIVAGKNPAEAFRALFSGAFGGANAIKETINRTTPLILTGLAVAFAFRCGLFNIGGEGQYIMGGFAAIWAGFTFSLPAIVHIPLCLLIGMVAGGLWGLLAALLKARFGVHEVISTIMLNFVAQYLVAWLVNNPFRDPSGQGTLKVKETAIVPNLPPTEIHAGIIIALILAALIWYLLYRTWIGYEVKAVGFSPLAAEYGGIHISRNMLLAMGLSGALAGLAGALAFSTELGRVGANVAFSGRGFDGIAVALIGRNEPFGVVLAALVFGALSAGNGRMQLEADVPKDLTGIVQAFIIIFMVAPTLIQMLFPFLNEKPPDVTMPPPQGGLKPPAPEGEI